jgi:two-component system cell cycle sensor histidine kinase/response regulator CckA
LRQVRDAADRGADLVQRMMSFSRQRRLAPRLLNLNDVVDRIAPVLERLLPETIQTTFVGTAPALPVRADPVAIEQILVNLATNARDALRGRGKVEIGTRSARAEHGDALDYAVLWVQDDGHGMPDAVQSRAFEPFFTTKEPGRGTGLGLASVHGLVEQHGGFVELASEPNRGTRVEVWLPLVEPATSTLENGPTPSVELPRGHDTVLVVEDEAAIRAAARHALEELGYRVLTAADGTEALDVLSSDSDVALVLTDVVMPRMTGPELVGRLRARTGRRPKLGFWTAYATEEHIGGLDPTIPIIEKPWSIEQLASFVRRCLDR